MGEGKRLVFTAIAVGLVGILTGRFINGDLLPSRGAEQYDERVITTEKALTVVHAHDNISRHEHVIKTVVTTTETTPHGWFHNFAETLVGTTPTNSAESTVKQGPNDIWVWGREFMPNTLTVPVGTRVTWVNRSVETHTVTSDTGLFDNQLYLGGSISDSFSYTFTEPGTYAFHCRPHSTMTGKIIVTGTNVTAPM